MKSGILGGGLTGLALASMVEGDTEVLEKELSPGGLCRTFQEKGFKFDIGGHILFSRDQEILKKVLEHLGDNVEQRRRNNKILFKGRFVKYPFENGLNELAKEDIFDCLIGYLKNSNPEPKNFKEWILYTFGDGFASKYLIPYNEKIWKFPLDKMEMGWVERVPRPPLEDILRSALGFETEGYTHQLHFYYPKIGGIEALITGLQAKVPKLQKGWAVRRIEKKGGKWLVSGAERVPKTLAGGSPVEGDPETPAGGAVREYDRIAVCYPVNEAIRMLPNVPEIVLQAAAELKYNSTIVVMVGINNETLMDKSAVYIPQPDVLPHRVCFMGFFSPFMVPQGCSSLIAEITAPPGNEILKMPDADLTSRVIEDLEKLGFLRNRDIIATSIQRASYGYPIYDLNRKQNMKVIRDYFDSLGIDLCGRFAEFDYINMDESFHRASVLARKWNTA